MLFEEIEPTHRFLETIFGIKPKPELQFLPISLIFLAFLLNTVTPLTFVILTLFMYLYSSFLWLKMIIPLANKTNFKVPMRNLTNKRSPMVMEAFGDVDLFLEVEEDRGKAGPDKKVRNFTTPLGQLDSQRLLYYYRCHQVLNSTVNSMVQNVWMGSHVGYILMILTSSLYLSIR